MDKKMIFIAKAEKDIAALLESMLLREGYNVISVSDEKGYTAFIEESLRRYKQEKDRVDLIINGFNVEDCLGHYSSFCRINPDCKMIILTAGSNYINQIRQNPGQYERVVDCILLPCNPKQLLSTVKKALEN